VTDTPFGVDITNQGNGAPFTGGGQVGYNYQVNNFVLGVEAHFDWTANNSNSGGGTLIRGNIFQVTSNNTWITTLTGRLCRRLFSVLCQGRERLATSTASGRRRHSEHEVIVRHRQQLRLAPGQPERRQRDALRHLFALHYRSLDCRVFISRFNLGC
jgi:hypothetical protein